MVLRDFFSLALDIGTFLAAVVSLLTLCEMRKQRLTTIQPDIVLQNIGHLHLYYKPNLDLFASWPYLWSLKPVDPENVQLEPNMLSAFNIDLINVGVNTAKNVTYRWEYDIEHYVSAVTRLNVVSEITFSNDFRSDIIITRSKTLSILPGIDKCRPELFFLAVGNSFTIPFCESYTYLLSLWVHGKFQASGSSSDTKLFNSMIDEFNQFPPLSLFITFFDLSGKKYTRQYIFSFSFAMLGHHESYLAVKVLSK